jgi:hypothetical protein
MSQQRIQNDVCSRIELVLGDIMEQGRGKQGSFGNSHKKARIEAESKVEQEPDLPNVVRCLVCRKCIKMVPTDEVLQHIGPEHQLMVQMGFSVTDWQRNPIAAQLALLQDAVSTERPLCAQQESSFTEMRLASQVARDTIGQQVDDWQEQMVSLIIRHASMMKQAANTQLDMYERELAGCVSACKQRHAALETAENFLRAPFAQESCLHLSLRWYLEAAGSTNTNHECRYPLFDDAHQENRPKAFALLNSDAIKMAIESARVGVMWVPRNRHSHFFSTASPADTQAHVAHANEQNTTDAFPFFVFSTPRSSSFSSSVQHDSPTFD